MSLFTSKFAQSFKNANKIHLNSILKMTEVLAVGKENSKIKKIELQF